MTDVETSFSPQAFREALGQFATGVTIVTTKAVDGLPVGMTASSFNSVSIDPPLVLWSVTKTALSAAAFTSAKHYAIHVLATDQTELSNKFARRGGDKFGETDFHEDENSVPILAGVSARYDCKSWAIYEGGDHWIIVGQVIGIENSGKPALVFGQGAYALSAPLEALSANVEDGDSSDKEIRNLFQYQISQIFHRMVIQFHEVISKNGLTIEKWRIGSSLLGLASMPIDKLAVETHLDAETLEATLTEMAKDGQCHEFSEADIPHVSLTENGVAAIKRLMTLAKKQEENILSPLDDGQIDALKSSLDQLIAARQ